MQQCAEESPSLSAMSLLEIAGLAVAGKLRMHSSLQDFFQELRTTEAFQVIPIDFDVAEDTTALLTLRDPADRVIVATARVPNLRLVTSDQRIIESNLVLTIDIAECCRRRTGARRDARCHFPPTPLR